MKKLLFLCTGNSCRSQMAEGYGKKYLSDLVEVYSAGTEKHGLNPFMLEIMKEDNIDMSGHYSKTLAELGDIDFDFVITLCGDAHENCPAYLKKAFIFHKGFKDPAKAKGSRKEVLNEFRKIRDLIKYFVKNDLRKIVEERL
ncbi:arsenate reductase [Thermotomaculum hydrothermale]|uniref:Arsenate reductase n=1 Tax=Thermotomaculum hydrothermale TaxID=981385 RepID=A0A7R6PNJ2_9BACT|nr:arsenate reductase ArsC [Thermotomaculum hydrothermale]BBB33352.1 arsenate reductase [Thermotomaculum hydrothermale]